VKCKHCKQELQVRRFPLGYARACGTEGCAGNVAEEFWLTPEAAERRKPNAAILELDEE